MKRNFKLTVLFLIGVIVMLCTCARREKSDMDIIPMLLEQMRLVIKPNIISVWKNLHTKDINIFVFHPANTPTAPLVMYMTQTVRVILKID